jgi:hypothetical protein
MPDCGDDHRNPATGGTMLVQALSLAADKTDIELHLALPGIIAIVVGVLILIWPRFLNYLVAAYLILIGLIQVFDISI